MEPESLLQDILKTARQAGAGAADAILVERRDMSVTCRFGKTEEIERSESCGLGLRVLVGKRQAAVSTTDLRPESLQELAERAVSMARVAPEDPYVTLATPERYTDTIAALDLDAGKEAAPDALMSQAQEVEKAALDVEGITNSEGAEASSTVATVALATSEGFKGQYRKSQSAISVSVLAGEGTGMQRDYDYSMARHAADLRPAAEVGREAAERTLRKLHPKKLSTRQLPILFERRAARSLLGNLVSAVNGSAIARGTSFLKEKLGEPVFAPGITVTDDPLRPRGLGSRPFDGEGIAGKARTIIEDGRLTSWLLDLSTAAQLEMQTTGHASRGLSSAPSPSGSNFILQAGSASPEELLADMPEGFYVTELFGMGVNLVTGDYSQGAGGFWVEKGQIAYPVQEVTIAGHLLEMFAHLTPANDLHYDAVTCSPSVRVEKMTVAGS